MNNRRKDIYICSWYSAYDGISRCWHLKNSRIMSRKNNWEKYSGWKEKYVNISGVNKYERDLTCSKSGCRHDVRPCIFSYVSIITNKIRINFKYLQSYLFCRVICHYRFDKTIVSLNAQNSVAVRLSYIKIWLKNN